MAQPSSGRTSPGSDRIDLVLSRGILRVGTTMDTPVFSMRAADGGLEGFDMDMLDSLGRALGVKDRACQDEFRHDAG